MSKRVLITGGAGFIGSHAADMLLERGNEVRVLDNLDPQVHAGRTDAPDYLNREVEFIKGDVRDMAVVQNALKNVDAVLHLAAAVGVGQSMYEMSHYVSVNSLGTAVLLEALQHSPVERLAVASSMSIYGEGLYCTPAGRHCENAERSLDQLKMGIWEIHDARNERLVPMPTAEHKVPSLSSIYALSKYDQERMVLLFGRAYETEAVALRFFNVYGTRQALSNPYTGVLAIFASRYLNERPPLIFEDGNQMRDFVSVQDVAQACCLSLEKPRVGQQVFNIGSGEAVTVNRVADCLAQVLDKDHVEPVVTGKYRIGDIRHCFADISSARVSLGYEPRVSLQEGLSELGEWLRGQIAEDRVEMATSQLAQRGLTI